MELSSAAGSDLGLRDRKKSRTRAELTEAALRLFKERGFRATSVDQIAAEANVSRSTFFRYFGSKEGVLFSRSDEIAKLLVSFLAARPLDEGPLQAFEEALVEVAHLVEASADREVAASFEETMRSDPVLQTKGYIQSDRWTGVIADCFARRRLPDAEIDGSDRLAAATCVAVAQQIGNEWRQSDVGAETAIRQAFAELRRMAVPR
ncbi:MAG: TetR family transcriptional regulator [Actinomycetota bacterium]|nr:TetR family transcriptional regulator [Actinomycetota bacterium]